MSDSNGEELGLLPFDDGSTGRLIRRQWHNSAWYFSIVDVIAVLTDSDRPSKYWSDLKARMQSEEGFDELSAKIGQLKMLSADGKRYKTDSALSAISPSSRISATRGYMMARRPATLPCAKGWRKASAFLIGWIQKNLPITSSAPRKLKPN